MATDSLERTTNLLALLLEARQPLTLEQIVFSLDGQYPVNAVARRGAFERDKVLLRDIGVPLETEVLGGPQAGATGYRIDRGRYELAGLSLSDDERRALQLAVAAVRSTDAQFGLMKLGAETTEVGAVRAPLPQLAQLPALRDAVAARAEVQFRYHGAPRRLHPYVLMLRRGWWYVIGHDLAHDERRTYRVDRIEGDVTAGARGAFERPEGFDPLTAFPSDPKEIGEGDARARVLVDAPRAGLVQRELGDDAVVIRRDDGAIEFDVACANRDAFRSWLFGLGEQAEVLEPADVRADVVAWLRSISSGAAS